MHLARPQVMASEGSDARGSEIRSEQTGADRPADRPLGLMNSRLLIFPSEHAAPDQHLAAFPVE